MPKRDNTIRKTIFDWGEEIAVFDNTANLALKYMRDTGKTAFQDVALHVGRMLGMSPVTMQAEAGGATLALVHALALAKAGRSIWALEPEAYTALRDTDVPFELIRERLPRLPFKLALIMLPPGESLTVSPTTPMFEGQSFDIHSILLIEDIPERKWRMLGFTDVKNWRDMKYNRGWFDIDFGPTRQQLSPIQTRGQWYRDVGDAQIWELLFNLFLTLEHGHVQRQEIAPPQLKSPGKIKKFQRSKSRFPWTRINLSEPQRKTRAQRPGTEQTRASPVRHRVRGHWRSYWVLEPEQRPYFGVRERASDGRVLFRVAQWFPPFYRGSAVPDRPPESRYRVDIDERGLPALGEEDE